MRMRRFIVGSLMAGALFVMAAGPAGAASITYTPGTITYGVQSTTKVTELTPKATYWLQIYNPWGVPLIPGGLPVIADASGSWTMVGLDPDMTDLPGTYLFEVQSSDGKVVARTMPTLTGTNTYHVQHRLTS